MPDLIIIGQGSTAHASLAASLAASLVSSLAAGMDAVQLQDPVWSVVPGFRVDVLTPGGTTSLHAPRIIALADPADHGTPRWAVPRLLRARMEFDEARNHWTPVRDAAGETSVPGLFVAEPDIPYAAAELGEGPPNAIICPCEGVTRAAIEAAAAAGARHMNQLRAFTRCGMGACQGRICEEAAATLLARHVGGRTTAGQWTMRPPLIPLPLADLLGHFTYDDIPVPPAAPL